MRYRPGQIRSDREYFHQLDVDEIDEMHRHEAAKSRHMQMAQAAQTQDERILGALEKLGYDPTTVTLLHFVPLVHVAWVDGWISRAERECIATLAAHRGVNEGTPAHEQLMAWLDQRPSDEFFEGTLSSIQAILASRPPDERSATRNTLLQCCRAVAFASRGLLAWTAGMSLAKRRLVKEIAQRLDVSDQAMSSVATAA